MTRPNEISPRLRRSFKNNRPVLQATRVLSRSKKAQTRDMSRTLYQNDERQLVIPSPFDSARPTRCVEKGPISRNFGAPI